MIRTRFTEMFGLEQPVMSAPMVMHSGGALAGAVSAAGGLGSFGGIHASEGPEWVRVQAALARRQTDRPFAIGFITPFLPFVEEYFQAALDERPAAIAFSFADPVDWVDRAKDAGSRVICQIQTFADADLAVAAGADVLVAQGNDAGGHTGTMGLLPLLTGVAQTHPDLPLLAAGGIASGAALAAALLAGADGAWLGTAFLATPEVGEIDAEYKAAIVASDGSDTVFTRAYDIVSGLPWPTGIGERVRRDAFTDEWADREGELRAGADHAAVGQPILYGQSARFVDGIRPAAEVVSILSAEAERVLRSRPQSLVHD